MSRSSGIRLRVCRGAVHGILSCAHADWLVSGRRALFILGVWSLCSAACAADWLLSAPAASRRIFPEPNATISHSPLTFFWPIADSATAYSLQVVGPGGPVTVRTSSNYHVLASHLPAGKYAWRVTAHLPGKELVGTDRSFELTAPLSRIGDIDLERAARQISATQRPRFFPKAQEWNATTAALAGPRAQLLETLDKRGNARGKVALGETSPVAAVERSRVKRELSRLARDLEDAALMWRLRKDEKWRAQAEDLLAAIQSLDRPMIYADPHDLLSARFMLWARVIAYDWMHDALDDPARADLRSKIERGTRWLTAEILHPQRGLPRNPYDSQRAEVIGAAVSGAAALLGEAQSASQDFRDLLPLWIASLLPTVASDGATAASGAYALWDLADYTVPHADSLRWAADIDIAALTQIRRMGEWLAKSAPPGAPAVWWGDAAETIRRPEWDWAAQMLAARTPSEWSSWFVRKTGSVRFATVWHALAPVRASAGDPSSLATDRMAFNVFPISGLGILSTDFADPNALFLHFKSAPLGASAHSHFDQNSFVIAHKGRMLAIDSGSYDYWGSDHYKQWYRRTIAHNAITRDGGKGQESDALSGAANSESAGRIVRAENAGGVAYIVGDASAAYRPTLRAATRVVAHLPQGIVAVFDDVEASTAHRWEWNLHAVDARHDGARSLEIRNGPARACVDLYSTTPGNLAIERRSSPKVPREWGEASHDHVIYSLESPQNGARFLALFFLDCNRTPVNVRIAPEAIELATPQLKVLLARSGLTVQGAK